MAQRRGRGIRVPVIDLVLVAIVGLWLATKPVVDVGGSSIQLALGLAAAFVAPGYALVAALFPGDGTRTNGATAGHGSRVVTGIERLLLAVALSVCVVPLIGLGLNYTPWGIATDPLLVGVGGLTVLLTGVAAVRRWQLPSSARYRPGIPARFFDRFDPASTSRGALVLNALLIVGLLVAGAGIGVGALQTDQGEEYTEFYLVTEDEETGEFVADGYPETIPQDETDSVHVGISNQEGEPTEYTVVVVLQQFDDDGNQRVLQEQQTLDRFETTVGPGETVHTHHEIDPDLTGEDLRLTYLLYVDDPPDQPGHDPDDAYRQTHVWIDVPETAAD